MKIVVQDANILIDLQAGKVLEAFFRLGWEAHTTDAVLAEVEERLDDAVREGHLKVAALSAEKLIDLALLRNRQPRKISIEDCSLMDLADHLKASLLTGDANLRHCAEERKIEVRGTLWLLDKMLELKALTRKQAATALAHMMKAGRRLPAAECEARLKAWG